MKMTNPYSLDVEFIADRWETTHPRTSDSLLAQIKGSAEWIKYGQPNKTCNVVKKGEEEWPVELINRDWYLLTWENVRWWRTRASRKLNTNDWESLGLGWFAITDPEHPDYHPLFAQPVGIYDNNPVDKGKGKAVASRPPSTDIHSPREPEPIISEEEESEKSPIKDEDDAPPIRVATPMPGQWGRDLEEVGMSGQLDEVVKVDLDDFGDPDPEYGQLPRNTNAAA
jgi:hypothetical protein